MIKEQKPIVKTLLIFCCVLLLASLVLNIVELSTISTDTFVYISNPICILAILAGFGYTFGAFKKNSAKLFTAFMCLISLRSICTLVEFYILTINYENTNPLSCILFAMICVNLIMLTFATDLGKRTSIGLAVATLVLMITAHLRLIILYCNFSYVVNAIMSVSIGVITLMFVIGKYIDKAERGTK